MTVPSAHYHIYGRYYPGGPGTTRFIEFGNILRFHTPIMWQFFQKDLAERAHESLLPDKKMHPKAFVMIISMSKVE